MTQLQYRIVLVRSLLKHNLQNNLSGHLLRKRRPSDETTPVRLVEQYFPYLIPPNRNKKHAKRQCFDFSHIENKNNQTIREPKYKCTICDVELSWSIFSCLLYLTELLKETFHFEYNFVEGIFLRFMIKKILFFK